SFAGSGKSLRGSQRRRDPLDLVVVGVGHVEPPIVVHDAERMLKPNLSPLTVAISKLEQIFANDRFNSSRWIQISRTNRADFAVGEIQFLSIAGDPRRLCQPGIH